MRPAVTGIRRVIAGMSGSPGSLPALHYAEDVARTHGAILIPVLTWVPPGGDRADRFQPPGYLRHEWQEAACHRLQDALISVWGRIPDDRSVQPVVQRGQAGPILVKIAAGPGDLLVVGAGRRGALARMARSGKVSRYCLAHARCPVIAVPPSALAQDAGHWRLAWKLRNRALTPDRVLRDRGRAAT
jgi:nucleotide-binding universal stress UspA family protein